MKYHDRLTFREKLAKLLYKLPIIYMPISFERVLVGDIIPFVEGKNPHWKHLGKNCPCMSE